MSMTSKQIDELRAYAKDRKGELAKLINGAADTIEILSAKLSAVNMERSSQYYHDGWIPCSERMPTTDEYVLVCTSEDDITDGQRWDDEDGNWFIYGDSFNASDDDIVAWMPLPEPWKGEMK